MSVRIGRRSLRACAPCFVQPIQVHVELDMCVLECHADGYPRPEIRWEKSGKPVGRSRRVHTTRCGERCLLQIKIPQREDAGLYTCTATNIVGTATTHAKVSIPYSDAKKEDVSLRSPLSPIKMSGVRSRSKSRERSIESVVPENKLSVVSLKCRSQSTSRDSPQRSDTASKSKLSNFTSHIWKKNEPQNRLPPERTKVEIVLNGNTKLLSKSTDDCRKTRRSFLNRVKIADIFNGQKADDVLNEPVAEPTRKSSGKKCEKIAKDSIRTNGNVCSSPLIKNLPKKEGIINEQSTMQATTRERIMSYLKRLETSSVKPKGVPREQKSHSICDTRLETNAKFLTEQEVPIHSTKRNENEYSFFKFGKFRRRKSSESSKKSSTENIEYDSPGISSQEHKVLNSDSVLTTVSVNGTILKTNDSSDNHSKEQQDLNSSQVTYQISPDMADAILLKDVNSFQHTEISSTNRLSQAETCPPTDAFSLEAKRKYQDINSRTTEINLNTRLNQTENASVDDILSEGKSDFQPINSNIIESSSNNRLDQIENESTQAISLAARNDCNQVSYEITETDSNNRIGDEENTYDNAVSLETEKNIQQLKYEITGICLNDRLDEVKNTSSAIDTETVSDKTIVYSSLQNSEISVTTINKEMKDDTVKDTQNNVPECEAQEVSGTFRTSVSIPSIRVQKTQEQAEEKQDLRSSVQNSTAPTKDCDLNGERQSSRSLHGRKHCRGKIRYSSPLIEEECEVFLDENSSPKTESLESDLQRVSSPVECPARIVKGPQSVTVLRGESVTLAISFNGYPIPKVIWMKGGRVLVGNGRLSILEGREMSVVTVNDVTADDSGKYVVSVENEGGGDSCFASVAVVGFPEPPGGEPNVSDVTDHSLVLSWYGSMYDGGSVVTGYIVEMCSLPERKWHKVASSVNTSCSIQGLSKGQRYIFRVRAENRYGASHPSKESKVICLDDYLQYDTSSDEEPGEDFPTSVEIESGTIFTERFDLKEEVGKGRFGTVYRCVEKSCGRPRAAKIIRCVKMKDKEKVRQEIEIMNRLHHPKLMQVLAAFESGRNMIMVMEYISGGELFERVIADDFVLTEHDCILFMKQICCGVTYMHKHNVIHLDLKPENILCKTRTSHKIKIIDFGLARVYKPEENLRILFGTPEFVAPEVINYEPVCPASDMWSVGVICYVLLSGLSPFMGDTDTETFANITRGEMDFDDEAFEEISENAKDFISRLLVKKVKGRMSAEECLNHTWLATANFVQKRPLSTEKLKRFIIRRKWQKSGNAIRALGRMVSLSRSSLGSSCDSYSPVGSPTSSRSRSSLVSRSETTESGDSDVFQDLSR